MNLLLASFIKIVLGGAGLLLFPPFPVIPVFPFPLKIYHENTEIQSENKDTEGFDSGDWVGGRKGLSYLSV